MPHLESMQNLTNSKVLKSFWVWLVLLSLLASDQIIKLYIKSHYPLGEVGRLSNWCIIHFTENPGMAFGFTFGAEYGKIALTLFRVAASVWGIVYLRSIVKKKYPGGYIVSVVCILAGAMGNIFDSLFYGIWFDRGTVWNSDFNTYMGYEGTAQWGQGYAPWLQGCVVDMFYFPLIEGTFPAWLPYWGGESFEFFRPVFNLADACITSGVIWLLLFNKRYQKIIASTRAADSSESSVNPLSDQPE